MGQTNLGGGVPGHGPFSYVHLRISLPSNLDEDQELFGSGAPESYFLMRRSKDGFISATGMSVILNAGGTNSSMASFCPRLQLDGAQ